MDGLREERVEEKRRWVRVFVHGSSSPPVSNSHIFSCFNIDEGAQSVRAPTVDVRYVPNAKYLAHIPHQTGKSAPHQILQML